MGSGIILSAGVRQNLLSLQNTADLAATTQNRLATGRKVNSASDNAISFFTSSNLQNRASDLNDLLDNIGQAVQTLNAASKGIDSLTSLVQSAKSIAKQASQVTAPTQSYGAGTAVTSTATAEVLGTTDGAAITVANATTYSFDININGAGAQTVTYTSDADATLAEIQAGLTSSLATAVSASGAAAGSVVLAANTAGDGIKLTAGNVNTDFTIANNTGAGLTNGAVNSTNLLDTIVAAGGTSGSSTLSVTVGSGTAQTITFGTGSGQVHDLAGLNTALAGLTGVTASATGSGNTAISIQASASATANGLTIAGSTGVLASLGGLGTSGAAGTVSISSPDSTRTSLQTDYNNLLTQIDQLSKDASYNGINLLSGDSLKVTFNEKGTSSLTISGVSFDSTGLGLSSVSGSGTTSFQDNTKLDSVISSLDTALSTLRTQAQKFGTNITTVQTRQDFTKNLINTLQTGADSLVLADTNLEGANLLALQTRQQLSTTALSLANQASQAVLRLF